jgi:hypothetical protein
MPDSVIELIRHQPMWKLAFPGARPKVFNLSVFICGSKGRRVSVVSSLKMYFSVCDLCSVVQLEKFIYLRLCSAVLLCYHKAFKHIFQEACHEF